jgi:hypothetical protein
MPLTTVVTFGPFRHLHPSLYIGLQKRGEGVEKQNRDTEFRLLHNARQSGNGKSEHHG